MCRCTGVSPLFVLHALCLLHRCALGSRNAGHGGVVHLFAVAQHLGNSLRHLHVHTALDQVGLAVHAHKYRRFVSLAVFKQPDHLGVLLLHGRFCLLHCHRRTSSVCQRLLAVACAAALNAHHVLLAQPFCGLHGLPAHGSTLVQRVIAVAQLLHNVLHAAAFQFGGGIGVCAQHQRAEHCKAGRAAGALPDLRFARHHKAHVVDLADLAVEDFLRGGVLVRLHPVRVLADVVAGVGVHNGHKAVADGVGVLALQQCHGLIDQIHRQLCSGIQIRTAGHGGLRAGGDLRRIDHVGAAVQDIAHHGVHGAAALAGQNVGGLHHVVVDGGQVQHVGQCHPAAVLVHLCGDGGHLQCLSVRGHALGQRGSCLRQAVVPAELNGLAVVRRDGVAVAELVMHQRRLCQIQQGLLVVGLHLGGHACRAGGVLQLGACVRKHLQIQFLFAHLFVLLQKVFIFSRPPRGKSQNDSLSPSCPLCQLGPLLRGHVRHVHLHLGCAAGVCAVLCRPLCSLLDPRRHALLHLLGRACRAGFHQLVKVGGPVRRFQPDAAPDHVRNARVIQHFVQLKLRVLHLQLCGFRFPLRPHGCGALLVLHGYTQLFGSLLLGVCPLQLALHPVHLPGRLHADAALRCHRLVVFIVLYLAVFDGVGQRCKVVCVLRIDAIRLAQRFQQSLHLRRLLHVLHCQLRRALHGFLKLRRILALHQLAKGPALFRRVCRFVLRFLFHLLRLRLFFAGCILFCSFAAGIRAAIGSRGRCARFRALSRVASLCKPLLCGAQFRCLHRRCALRTITRRPAVSAVGKQLQIHHILRARPVVKGHKLRVQLRHKFQPVRHQLELCPVFRGRSRLQFQIRSCSSAAGCHRKAVFSVIHAERQRLHQRAYRRAHNVLPFRCISRVPFCPQLQHVLLGFSIGNSDHAVLLTPYSGCSRSSPASLPGSKGLWNCRPPRRQGCSGCWLLRSFRRCRPRCLLPPARPRWPPHSRWCRSVRR
nr:MAG TPA: hypothetical protein [Caudoviricetes sp.]